MSAGASNTPFTHYQILHKSVQKAANKRLSFLTQVLAFIGPQSERKSAELWQPRLLDRALRTVQEYSEKVEHIHLNPSRQAWCGGRRIGDGRVHRVFGHERG
jgi:hypothetical protein